jgi:hypothetical protein
MQADYSAVEVEDAVEARSTYLDSIGTLGSSPPDDGH